MSCGCPNTIVDQVQYPSGFMAGPCTMLPGYQSVYDPLTTLPIAIETPSMAVPAPVAPAPSMPSAPAPVAAPEVPPMFDYEPPVAPIMAVPEGFEAGVPVATGASVTSTATNAYNAFVYGAKKVFGTNTAYDDWVRAQQLQSQQAQLGAAVYGSTYNNALNSFRNTRLQPAVGAAVYGSTYNNALNSLRKTQLRRGALVTPDMSGYGKWILLALIVAVAALLYWKRADIKAYMSRGRSSAYTGISPDYTEMGVRGGATAHRGSYHRGATSHRRRY